MLELELQVPMSPPTWTLGTEFGSSERALSVLNCQAIAPVPHHLFLSYNNFISNTLIDASIQLYLHFSVTEIV